MQLISDLPFGSLLVIAIVGGVAVWRYRGGKKQFTLRGMLVGMFLVTLPLAWFAQGMREYLREQRAIAGLREAGIDVRTDTFRRPLESFFFGKRWQQRAFAVYADKSLVTRRELELIGELPFVSTIRIHQGTFSDDDLINLAALPRLRELTLDRCAITGAGLKHLPAQLKMESLSLSFCPIDDAALQHVSRWKTLERLELNGTQVTDLGLASLAELKNLDYLSLDHTAITDDGIRRHEPLFQQCSTLTLMNTEVTKSAVTALKKQGSINWSHAPSAAHRKAAAELLMQGIEVTVRDNDGASCTIAIRPGWNARPETAKLLKQLCSIQSVTLNSSKPIDFVVPLLADLPQLHGIRIEGQPLSVKGLRELSKQSHPELRLIEVEQCLFSAQLLSELSAFSSLEHLFLGHMYVESADAPHFAGFRHLRYLTFHNSAITDATAYKIRVLLPFTEVSYGTKNASLSLGNQFVNWGDLGTPRSEQDAMVTLMRQGMAFDRPNRDGQFRHAWGSVKDFEAAIPELLHLTALESLIINSPQMPPSLAKLTKLSHLRDVSIHSNDFRGWDLIFLGGLPNLQMLSLQGSSFQEALGQLDGRVPALVSLHLSSNDSQSSWLTQLPTLRNLETLRVFGQKDNSLDVSPLAKFANLRSLDVNFSSFSDAHLATLAPLQRLKALNLSSTEITDASIDLLAERPSLRRLNVSNTKLTREGVEKLRTALPLTQIEASYPPTGPASR